MPTKIRFMMLMLISLLLQNEGVQARTDFYSNDSLDSSFPYDSVYTWSSAVVDMNSGQIKSADTFNSSTLNLIAGNIDEGLSTWNESTVKISGGRIDWFVEAYDTSVLNIHGGKPHTDSHRTKKR